MIFFLLFLLNAHADDLACFAPQSLVSEEFLSMPATIFPAASKRDLHFLYKHFKRNHPSCGANQVWVQGPLFTEDGITSEGGTAPGVEFDHEKLGNSFCMSAKEFDRERSMGMSVFETRLASGSKNEGTSFLIGGNIIMTNHHVAGGGSQPEDCRKTEITLNNQEGKWIQCKKLLFCDKATDYCFVEMQPPAGYTSLEQLAPRVPVNCLPIGAQQDAKLIGNSYTTGIQSSDGRVEKEMSNGKFRHRIPMVGGSSGSPIFDKNGNVIGINTSHDAGKDYVNNNMAQSNYGTSLFHAFKTMKKARSNAFNPLAMYGTPTLEQQRIDRNIDKVLSVLPAYSNCR